MNINSTPSHKTDPGKLTGAPAVGGNVPGGAPGGTPRKGGLAPWGKPGWPPGGAPVGGPKPGRGANCCGMNSRIGSIKLCSFPAPKRRRDQSKLFLNDANLGKQPVHTHLLKFQRLLRSESAAVLEYAAYLDCYRRPAARVLLRSYRKCTWKVPVGGFPPGLGRGARWGGAAKPDGPGGA